MNKFSVIKSKVIRVGEYFVIHIRNGHQIQMMSRPYDERRIHYIYVQLLLSKSFKLFFCVHDGIFFFVIRFKFTFVVVPYIRIIQLISQDYIFITNE